MGRKRVGRYELGRTLGKGTFSKVKHSVDTSDGSQWAIKVVDREQLDREAMGDQLRREIAILRALQHKNVVQMREVLQSNTNIYIVLELVTGGELFDRIVASKRFDEPTARKYFRELVMGVAACHRLRVAHRDLKPENLLLDAQGHLKISDFGLSNLSAPADDVRAGAGGQLMQTVCGTPNYVAPEVLKEVGYDGFRADIWSCGVVLFVMVAGYLPFDDSSMAALFSKIERAQYRVPKSLSPPLLALIQACLTPDPAKRITLEGIVASEWFRTDASPATLAEFAAAVAPVAPPTVDDAAAAAAVQQLAATSSGSASAAATPPRAAAAAAPAAPPAAAPAAAPASAGDTMDVFGLVSMLTSTTFSGAVGGPSGGVVECRTRFVLDGGVADATAAVTDTLAALRASPRAKAADGSQGGAGALPAGAVEVKGFATAGAAGLLTYVARLIPVDGSITLVEMKRLRGDPLAFNAFYLAITQELRGRILSDVRDEDV